MKVSTGIAAALAAGLTACAGIGEKECGLYDFDCEDAPQTAPLFSPRAQPAPAVETDPVPAADRQQTDVTPNLEQRVRRLEQEIAAIRQQLDELRGNPAAR